MPDRLWLLLLLLPPHRSFALLLLLLMIIPSYLMIFVINVVKKKQLLSRDLASSSSSRIPLLILYPLHVYEILYFFNDDKDDIFFRFSGGFRSPLTFSLAFLENATIL